jgi:hypothetical protein
VPHEESWKYAQKVGPDKAKKEVVEVYDDVYGHYVGDESGKADSLHPSKDTKRPFGSLSGGK